MYCNDAPENANFMELFKMKHSHMQNPQMHMLLVEKSDIKKIIDVC